MYRCLNTVVFVDDHRSFLKALQGFMSQFPMPTKFFTNPLDAKAFCTKPRFEYEMTNLASYLQSARRFENVGVIVTDQDMPSLMGLELLKQIATEVPHLHEVAKILLTGCVDDHVAINAFNRGDIDGFLRKDDSDVIENMLVLVNRLRDAKQMPHSQTPLEGVVSHIFQEDNMLECYPTDTKGSHIMLNARGDVIFVQAHSEEDIDDMLCFARDCCASRAVIRALERKEQTFSHLGLALGYSDSGPEPQDWHLGPDGNMYTLFKFHHNTYYTVARLPKPPEIVALQDLPPTAALI